MDYEETFSPVALLKAIRILLSIATFYDYEIWQMDVKIVVLNGNLEESIYMAQTEGFIELDHEERVCKLKRSIYGLKQASRSWNIKFDTAIKSYGFKHNVTSKGFVGFYVLKLIVCNKNIFYGGVLCNEYCIRSDHEENHSHFIMSFTVETDFLFIR